MVQKVKVLDGGFSTQLIKYVAEPVDGDPLWTAKFVALNQKKCALVHRDFVIAGAEIITTGSYQSSIEGYKAYLGMERHQALEVIKDSVKLARQGIEMAQEETDKKYSVEIAGSVGPYGAFLHDGSEYTGSYCKTVSEEEMINWHRPRIAALVEAGADILALETLPCIKEALALTKLLKEFPSTKAWISFSIKTREGISPEMLNSLAQAQRTMVLHVTITSKEKDGESISSGENFCEAVVKSWATSNQLIAIGANCCHPSLVTPLFKPLIKNHPEIPTIVYPNNGEKYDVLNGRWLDKEKVVNIEDFVPEWLDLGITLLGGCCRTNSEDISNMSKRIKHWEKRRANVA